MAVDKCIISTLVKWKFLQAGPAWPKVALPFRGCVARPSAFSAGVPRPPQVGICSQNYVGLMRSCQGSIMRPAWALCRLTDSSLPRCHLGAVEFNLPDGEQINLPICRSCAYVNSALIYSLKLRKPRHF